MTEKPSDAEVQNPFLQGFQAIAAKLEEVGRIQRGGGGERGAPASPPYRGKPDPSFF